MSNKCMSPYSKSPFHITVTRSSVLCQPLDQHFLSSIKQPLTPHCLPAQPKRLNLRLHIQLILTPVLAGSETAMKDLTFAVLMSSNNGNVNIKANWEKVEQYMKVRRHTVTLLAVMSD